MLDEMTPDEFDERLAAEKLNNETFVEQAEDDGMMAPGDFKKIMFGQ